MKSSLVAFVGILGMCGASAAQLETFTGSGGPINDLSDNRFVIFIAHHGPHMLWGYELDITHTWVGDLYVEVRHKTPNDYACVLIDRPGVPQSTFGNSDDLDGVYAFSDGFTPIPETVGGSGVISAGAFGPAAGQTIRRMVADSFGEWSLLISDEVGGDEGMLRSWSMSMLYIPTPGSAGLALAACPLATKRRRP